MVLIFEQKEPQVLKLHDTMITNNLRKFFGMFYEI